MRGVAGFLSVLFVLSALSGCTDPAAEAKEDAAGSDHADGGDASGENSTTNMSVVRAVITVVSDGNITEPANGSVPATVGTNITFDGSASTGDNLTFAWDFGDNATAANASATHAFATSGLFNVTLTVASGNDTSTASVLLNVTSAAPAGGVVWMDTKSFTGTLAVGNPNAAFQANTDYRDHTVTILASDANGTAVIAKRVRWTLDGSGAAAVDMTLYWRQGTSNLATAATSNTVDESLVYEGDTAPGDYVIRVRFNTGANASYTVAGEIDYEAASG